jgi:hypothetical protein
MIRLLCVAVLLCLPVLSGYGTAAADEVKANANTVTARKYPQSGERLANPLNAAPCFSGNSEFVASWQGRKFLAPCRFIHETIGHLRAASTFNRTGSGFPLNSDHVHLAIPSDLWEAEYRFLPKEQTLSALLREPRLVAVYHATSALTPAESTKIETSRGLRQSYANRQVIGHYNGRGVEVLPDHYNALAHRYRSVAWFYFWPSQVNEPAAGFDISFDHYLAAECLSSDWAEGGMVRIHSDEKDRAQACGETSLQTVAESGIGVVQTGATWVDAKQPGGRGHQLGGLP